MRIQGTWLGISLGIILQMHYVFAVSSFSSFFQLTVIAYFVFLNSLSLPGRDIYIYCNYDRYNVETINGKVMIYDTIHHAYVNLNIPARCKNVESAMAWSSDRSEFSVITICPEY